MEDEVLVNIVNVKVNEDGYLEWNWEPTIHNDLISNEDNKDLYDEMSEIQTRFANVLIKLGNRMEEK